MKRISLVAIALLFSALLSSAQIKKPENVRVVPPVTPVTAAPGSALEVPVYLNIAPGFHINAEKPSADYLVATKLEWVSAELKLAGMTYPPAEKHEFDYAPGEKVDVYQGDVKIVSRFAVPRNAQPAKLTLQGKVTYQACDNKVCYRPVTVPFEAAVEIVKPAGKKPPMNADKR